MPVDALDVDKLIEQAKEFHTLYKKFQENFEDEYQADYYLLSTQWLKKWMVYTSYPEVTS